MTQPDPDPPTSVLEAWRECPKCGLQAWAVPELIYASTNLSEQDGSLYAHNAYYRCAALHVHHIPYSEAMVRRGTLSQITNDLKEGRWKP